MMYVVLFWYCVCCGACVVYARLRDCAYDGMRVLRLACCVFVL